MEHEKEFAKGREAAGLFNHGQVLLLGPAGWLCLGLANINQNWPKSSLIGFGAVSIFLLAPEENGEGGRGCDFDRSPMQTGQNREVN